MHDQIATANYRSDTTPEPSGARFVRAVRSSIHRLYREANSDVAAVSSRARAKLSRLRRGIGSDPSRSPLVYSELLDSMSAEIPQEYLRVQYGFSEAEMALFTAFTLFAEHQRSASQPMHNPEVSFGTAFARLAKKREIQTIKPRFDALISARSQEAIVYQLRSVIGLLNSEEIAFDYGRFANDLRKLFGGKYRDDVLLVWTRDFSLNAFRTETQTN